MKNRADLVRRRSLNGVTPVRPTEVAYTWRVQAVQPVSYDIRLVPGLLDPSNGVLAVAGMTDAPSSARRLLILDSTVDDLYGRQIRGYFAARHANHLTSVLRVSEETKTMDSVFAVARELDRFGLARRNEPIVAFGGGVLLDIVGLAANLFRRGTTYIRVPTTLVGLVDAGVGIKTGVNFDNHKNRLGTYFAPGLTLLDPGFLTTLDERQLSNGLAEVLKVGLAKDRHLFGLLEAHGRRLLATRFQATGDDAHDGVAFKVLCRAINGMLEDLQPNLWEQRLERTADYGHSISPVVEMRALPDLLHGEAVTIDMAVTTMVAWRRGMVGRFERDRILDVMRCLKLPLWHEVCESELLAEALMHTTQHRAGRQRLPLPIGIGDVAFVNDVQVVELSQAAADLREAQPRG